MPDTTLPNTGQTAIDVGGSENTWGTKVNANATIVDNLFHAANGHDHGDGKGAPIPSGGLAGLVPTSQGLVAAVGDDTFGEAGIGAGLSLSEANVLAVYFAELAAKAAPVDADLILLSDSAAANALKKVTRANLLTGAVLAGTPYAHDTKGSVSGAVELNAGAFGSFSLTSTGNTTLSITGAATGKLYVICVEVTHGGASTFTHPAGTTHPGGIAPSLSPAGTDILFYASRNGGATWRCSAEIAHS